jgi:uncharacterized protein YecE (DUF72 family)
MGTIRVGTCGFCLRQRDYYGAFDVVELQQTFYRPPQLATAQRWRADAADGFEFTLKAYQAITHPPASPTWRRTRISDADRSKCGGFQDTPVVRKAWKTTLELARTLETKLVIFQCPATFRPTDENIDRLWKFFEWAHRDRIRFGWEPRGDAWTDQICVELSLTHVVDPFVRPCMRPRPPYFRLRGIGGHRHRYTDQELSRLHAWCSAKQTYCMFNNAFMADDARRFHDMAGDPRPTEGIPDRRMPP